MSTLTIATGTQADPVVKAISGPLTLVLRAVRLLMKQHRAAAQRVQGICQMRRLAQNFDETDPAQAEELRWLAGRG